MPGSKLLARILEISQKAELGNVAVAFYDYESLLRFSYRGDQFLHAASTFKAAILFALFKAVEQGKARLDDPLHVRNRFHSIIDNSPYRIERDRDGDSAIHKHTGQSLPIRRLAHAMITRSSNLATNLLLEFLGVPFIRSTLDDAGIHGLEVRRGVEDQIAYDRGINNEATADGLLRLFRAFVDEGFLTEEHKAAALEILFAQEFNSMIPSRIPDGVRVAHKTGEISTHCHDAGLVYAGNRQPYVLAVMTESAPSNTRRQKAVAEIASHVHRYLVGGQKEEKAS